MKEHTHQWSDTWSSDGENHWHDCLADGCTVTDNSQKDGFSAHDYVNGVCSVCGQKQDTGDSGSTGGSGSTGDNGNTGNSGNTGNAGSNGPKTGDMGVALWSTLAGLCGCGLVAMAVTPRYKGKRVA